MISHCCASCGTPLGPSSRMLARPLRMWVARCPRCGFAARWSPRRARAPFRTWARLRALNTRLGIAIGAGHAAGGAMCFLGSLLVLRRVEVSTALAGKAPPASTIIEECAVLWAIAAVAGAVSTCAFPRHSSLPARCALAWIACAAPIVALILVASIGSDTKRVWWNLHAAMRSPALAFGAGAALAAPLASLVLAAAASPVQSAIEMQFRARHRQLLRARAAHTEPGSMP